jgi:methionyl-tRNA formyltransferase
VIEIDDLKDPEAANTLKGLGAELWVVVAFPIIPDALLEIPLLGTVNLHASLLPRYRGAAPIQWALIEGASVTGVTTFFIDAGVDTGAICLQRETEIETEETAGELSERLSGLGAQLMLETLNRIEKGDAPRLPQDDAAAIRAPKLTKEDGALDWTLAGADLVNRIRGLNPWPGCYTGTEKGRLLLHRARLCGSEAIPWSGEMAPGTVGGFLEDGTPVVAAGDGSGVALLEIQREGRRSSTGAEVARGLRWKGGERLRTA